MVAEASVGVMQFYDDVGADLENHLSIRIAQIPWLLSVCWSLFNSSIFSSSSLSLSLSPPELGTVVKATRIVCRQNGLFGVDQALTKNEWEPRQIFEALHNCWHLWDNSMVNTQKRKALAREKEELANQRRTEAWLKSQGLFKFSESLPKKSPVVTKVSSQRLSREAKFEEEEKLEAERLREEKRKERKLARVNRQKERALERMDLKVQPSVFQAKMTSVDKTDAEQASGKNTSSKSLKSWPSCWEPADSDSCGDEKIGEDWQFKNRATRTTGGTKEGAGASFTKQLTSGWQNKRR